MNRPDLEVLLSVSINVTLNHAECFPDWQPGDDIDPRIYAALIEGEIKKAGLDRFLSDWDLLREADVYIKTVHTEVNPAYKGDDVLFGEPPDAETVTISEARF